MPVITTAKFPRPVLDRLKKYGLKGQTYAEIVSNLMERVDSEEFRKEQFLAAVYATEHEKNNFVPLDKL